MKGRNLLGILSVMVILVGGCCCPQDDVTTTGDPLRQVRIDCRGLGGPDPIPSAWGNPAHPGP